VRGNGHAGNRLDTGKDDAIAGLVWDIDRHDCSPPFLSLPVSAFFGVSLVQPPEWRTSRFSDGDKASYCACVRLSAGMPGKARPFFVSSRKTIGSSAMSAACWSSEFDGQTDFGAVEPELLVPVEDHGAP